MSKPCSFAASGGELPEPKQQWALAIEDEDLGLQQGVWESGPGVLSLKFQWNEIIVGLEGEAVAENQETGEILILKTGTTALFKKGTHWKWKIPKGFKKLFTIIE